MQAPVSSARFLSWPEPKEAHILNPRKPTLMHALTSVEIFNVLQSIRIVKQRLLSPHCHPVANWISSTTRTGEDKVATVGIIGTVIGALMVVLVLTATTILYFQRRRPHRYRQCKEKQTQRNSYLRSPNSIRSTLQARQLSSQAERTGFAGCTRHERQLLGDTMVEGHQDITSPMGMPGCDADVAELEG